MIYFFFFTIIIKLLISPLVTAYNEENLFINEFILFSPDIILILISIFLYLRETDRHKNFLSLLILFQFLIVILSNYYNDISLINSLQNISRTLLPISLLYLLCFQPKIIAKGKLEKLGISLIVLIFILNFYAFINFSHLVARGISFLPSYFGNRHNSAYILLASYFIIFVIYQTSQKSFRIKTFLTIYTIFCLYMLFFGWGIRTILLSFLLFHILHYFSKKNIRNPFLNFMIISIVALTITIILVQFNIIFFDSIDLLSSGRLSMYNTKFSLIGNFTIMEILIGKGFGSDLIITDVWWWDFKGSHNDFISLFFENGILFIFLFVITLVNIYKLFQGDLEKTIFLTIIFTSLVSNGFVVRPMAMYLMVLVFLILNNYTEIKKNEKKNN